MKPSFLDPPRNSFATSLLLCIPLVFRVSTHLTLMGSLPILCFDERVRHSFHDLHLVQILHSQSTCFPHLDPKNSKLLRVAAWNGVAMDDSLCLLLSLSASSSAVPADSDVTLFFRGTLFFFVVSVTICVLLVHTIIPFLPVLHIAASVLPNCLTMMMADYWSSRASALRPAIFSSLSSRSSTCLANASS